MPNHQQRRAPLPADYQYPTHDVECDCPSCRNRYAVKEYDGTRFVVGHERVFIGRA